MEATAYHISDVSNYHSRIPLGGTTEIPAAQRYIFGLPTGRASVAFTDLLPGAQSPGTYYFRFFIRLGPSGMFYCNNDLVKTETFRIVEVLPNPRNSVENKVKEEARERGEDRSCV